MTLIYDGVVTMMGGDDGVCVFFFCAFQASLEEKSLIMFGAFYRVLS